MNKFFLHLIFFLILTGTAAAQTTPAVDVPLSITDGVASKELRFGLHPTATDGIDVSLGETEQPPPPPTGVFDARFIGDDIGISTMGQGLIKDYRFGYDTTKGQRIHELKYQVGTGTTITFNWTFPTGVTGRLQDLINGTIIDVAMSGTGNYTVTNPGVLNKLKMTITYNLTGASVPSAPTLLSPANGSTNQSKTPTLSWDASSGATSYRLQVATDSLFSSIIFNDSTIATTSKQLPTLNANTKYFWRVNAKNSAGTSAYSTIWNFTTAAEIGWCNLQWPQSGTITQGGDYSVYAQIWIDGVTPGTGQGAGVSAWIGYNTTNTNPNTWTNWISASYNSSGPQTNNDEYMADIGSSLTAGTYYYASRFQYQSGEYKYGGYSATGGHYWDGTTNVSGVLTVNPSAPSSPTLLSPTNGATGQSTTLTLSWNASSGASTYRLQVATDNGFSNIIFNDSTISGTSQQISSLSAGTTYYWRVNAKNAGGTSSYSSIWNFTTAVGTPAVPTLLSPANGSINQPTTLTMSWSASSGASFYVIQVATDSLFSTIVYKDTIFLGTSIQISSLLAGKKYYWHVNASNTSGTSAYSATWNFTTIVAAPSAPTLISPLNGATGLSINPTLTWYRPENAVTFRLQVSASPTFSPLVVDQASIFDTFYNISGLLNNTTYFWKVNAMNAGGTSNYSTSFSFTTLSTSVENEGGVPTTFSVSQNFPNPFNPSTTIRYSIPAESFVKIKIVNSIGKIVDEKVNRIQSAGNYKLKWNGDNLPAGIYFYSIEARSTGGKQSFQSVKKMILIK
ncbi:MAG: T9SS type A sorting domain-containing protein [Ignavibacteria bacterium]|nr:T9SS type A sorting domain-containing protein [Ignavibacteria bacterium]